MTLVLRGLTKICTELVKYRAVFDPIRKPLAKGLNGRGEGRDAVGIRGLTGSLSKLKGAGRRGREWRLVWGIMSFHLLETKSTP